MSTLEVAQATRELTLSQAVGEAFREEMRRDPTIFVIGEDVAEAGTPFKMLSGLVDEFGTERVVDSPISEPGITGLALGAAMTGMRPVVDIMFGDFVTLIMDQVVNQAAKIHYMSGGSLKAPLTVRTTLGATSSMVYVALDAAAALAERGVSAEVVDPRTLVPLDRDTLIASAQKTGRVIVVDEGHQSYGASAELAAAVAEGAFWHLDAPVRRVGAMDVPVPFSPPLEDETVPTPERIVETALELLGKKG